MVRPIGVLQVMKDHLPRSKTFNADAVNWPTAPQTDVGDGDGAGFLLPGIHQT
jgi:hypothetical protein